MGRSITLPEHITLPVCVLLCMKCPSCFFMGSPEDIPQSTALSARHIYEQRWFAVSRVHCSSPLSAPLSISPLLLSFSRSFRSQMLQVLSVDVSITSLPLLFSPLPSLSQTVDWYGNTTLCIFSTATDGAVAACQRPERSLSQLSGHSP